MQDGDAIQETVEGILAREPLLNNFGFGLPVEDQQKSLPTQRALLARHRQELRDHTDEIERARQWINAHLKRRKTFNKTHNSDTLREMVELDIGYTSPGAWICAMLLCGFEYRTSGQNVYFNIAKRID